MIKKLKILFLILSVESNVIANSIFCQIKRHFSIVNIVELTAFKKLLL